MRKALFSGLALALVFVVSGCGDSLDSVMKDSIKLKEEQATILEGIKSKEDAEKAKSKLEDLNKKIEDLKKRTEKLMKDKKVEDALAETLKAAKKHEDAAKKAEEKAANARKKLMENKDAYDVVKDLIK
jgi:TolA-binding protein